MDELQQVRDFYGPAAAPDTAVTARAKTRLFADEAAASARRPGLRWETRRRLVRIGVPAVAVGAAAAIVAAGLAQGPAASARPRVSAGGSSVGKSASIGVFRLPAGGSVGTASGSGKQILLTAAHNVVGVPTTTPKSYYVTPRVVGNFVRLGPKNDPYQFLETVNRAWWAARAPHGTTSDMEQEVSLKAATPADEKAWQKNGAPTVWAYMGQSEDIADPTSPDQSLNVPLSTGPEPWTALGAGSLGQQFQVGGEDLSFSQLLRLPADPAKLKKIIIDGGLPPGGNAVQYLLWTVPSVIEMPVTPAVRAALWKVLAALPGVQDQGTVTDVDGQQGQAISYTAGYKDCAMQPYVSGSYPEYLFSSCTIKQTVVIGSDGMPMAEELSYTKLPAGADWTVPGGLFSYETFQTPYWTNGNPPKAETPPNPVPSSTPVPPSSGSTGGQLLPGGSSGAGTSPAVVGIVGKDGKVEILKKGKNGVYELVPVKKS
ncbi:MAG TPA: hypothetical protein VK817_26915 [Trebonia sp.]|nr:hypothetical protein [Trebonia sp.]